MGDWVTVKTCACGARLSLPAHLAASVAPLAVARFDPYHDKCNPAGEEKGDA